MKTVYGLRVTTKLSLAVSLSNDMQAQKGGMQ